MILPSRIIEALFKWGGKRSWIFLSAFHQVQANPKAKNPKAFKMGGGAKKQGIPAHVTSKKYVCGSSPKLCSSRFPPMNAKVYK